MKNPLTRICCPSKNRHHDRGFTLVELLVVIVMIGALAALLFSLIGKMKEKAYQVNALSAIRQVGGGGVAYSAENNGDINTLKFPGDKAEGDTDEPGNNKWHVNNSFWGRLQPYLFPTNKGTTAYLDQKPLGDEIKLGLNQLFNTPNSSVMSKTILSTARIYHDGSGLPVPLSFNKNVHTTTSDTNTAAFMKVSSFSDMSRVLYATYGFSLFTEANGQAYVPMPIKPASSPIYYLSDRKALMMFLDGHAEPVSPPMPSRLFK